MLRSAVTDPLDRSRSRPADHSSGPDTTIRVASIPSSHVYVRHLSPASDEDATRVRRLDDPVPPGRRPEQSTWWPPVMLDAAWIDRHADDFDVFHVHFGFDAVPPAELRDVVQALEAHSRPLVLTVHDLRNPHHPDRRAHDEQLDVLVPAADELLTLTRGAAGEIVRRWGRVARVVPHPHVVEAPVAERIRDERDRREGGPFRVGVHLKSRRAGMDPATVLPALERGVAAMPDAVLQVNVHREAVDKTSERYDEELAGAVAGLGSDVDLRVHDYFTDDQLWGYLGSLDVSVLPYRFGTHSGWLEACRDVGTQVVAPTCGFYADQGPVHSYVLDESDFDESSLVAALRSARERPAARISMDERSRQRDEIARVHRDLYARVVAR